MVIDYESVADEMKMCGALEAKRVSIDICCCFFFFFFVVDVVM